MRTVEAIEKFLAKDENANQSNSPINEAVTKQDFTEVARKIKAAKKEDSKLRSVLMAKPAVVDLIVNIISSFNPGAFDKDKFLKVAGLKAGEEEDGEEV